MVPVQRAGALGQANPLGAPGICVSGPELQDRRFLLNPTRKKPSCLPQAPARTRKQKESKKKLFDVTAFLRRGLGFPHLDRRNTHFITGHIVEWVQRPHATVTYKNA